MAKMPASWVATGGWRGRKQQAQGHCPSSGRELGALEESTCTHTHTHKETAGMHAHTYTYAQAHLNTGTAHTPTRCMQTLAVHTQAVHTQGAHTYLSPHSDSSQVPVPYKSKSFNAP